MNGTLADLVGRMVIESKEEPRVEEMLQMPKLARVVSKGEDHIPNLEELTIPGLERSMSAIRESGSVKYDELLIRLTTKAKNLIQLIKLCKLPNQNLLEIAVKRQYERFVQFPWLLHFDKKMEIFNMLLTKEKEMYSSHTLSKKSFCFTS